MTNPLVPSPERKPVWWECSKHGCDDYFVEAAGQPPPHLAHPTSPMRKVNLESDGA